MRASCLVRFDVLGPTDGDRRFEVIERRSIDIVRHEVTADGETSEVARENLDRILAGMPDISDWDRNYHDPYILDGAYWELTAGFNGSGPELRWSGINQYPYSYPKLRRMFEDARELKIKADVDRQSIYDPDRYLGCLVGGALGDALEYPVEFLTLDGIRERYGPEGITDLQLSKGRALISDDTQMAMFTAYSIPFTITRQITYGIAAKPSDYAFTFYREWMYMQRYLDPENFNGARTWLYHSPELRSRRAPGNTCVMDICGNKDGAERDSPRNDSKGCGGVMRTAPLGLNPYGKPYSVETLRRSLRFGADNAASTHGNIMGWIPAAMLSGMINCIACGRMGLHDAIAYSYMFARDEFLDHLADVDNLGHRLLIAYDLSQTEGSDADLISGLGEGWVADEALTMAVFACARHPDDVMGALICAVNHSGDSDSVGAIAGNLMGAMVGYRRLCEEVDVSRIECLDVLLRLAEDIWTGYVDEEDTRGNREWVSRYVLGEVPRDIAANHPDIPR